MNTHAVPARSGGLAGAIGSEWTKLASVRYTWWCVLAAAGLTSLYAVLQGLSTRATLAAGDPPATVTTPPEVAVAGVFYLGQFAVLALATLAITAEYTTGSIRSSLQWVPARQRFLAAKAVVLVATLFVLGILLALLGTGLAALTGGAAAPAAGFGDTLRTTLSVGGYLALLGLLTLGLGTALRGTAGTLTAAFILLLVLPMIMVMLNWAAAADYFPGSAGMVTMLEGGARNPITGMTAPYDRLTAFGILGGWVLACGAAGLSTLRNRDA